MPIDPSIVSGLAPAVANLSQMGTFAQQQTALEAHRKNQEERRKEQELRDILSSAPDDDSAIDALNKRGYAEYASKLRTQLDGHRKSLDEGFLNDLKKDDAQVSLLSRVAQGVHDAATLDQAKAIFSSPVFGKEGQILAGMLPPEWDDEKAPTLIQGLVEKGLQASDIVKGQQESYNKLMSGEWDRGTAELLATADTPEDAQGVLAMLKARRAPKSIIEWVEPFVKNWGPNSRDQAANMALTEKERRDLAIREKDKPAASTGFTLGQGQKRFDAEGRLIASVAPRPVAASGGGIQGTGTGSKNAAGEAMPSDYQTLLNRSMFAVPAVRRGLIIQTANRLWAEGKIDDLKDVIRQSAVEGENVDTKNLIRGRRATLASLADTRSILEEMKAKGVPTGFFTGTVEDMARKVGKTTNPEYVNLANRLAGTLINYRRAATGVAFGEREAAQYDKMFPNYKNDLPVNLALIKGLEREMSTYDRAYWEDKMGKAGAELLGVVPSSAPAGGGTNKAPDDLVPGPVAALLAKEKDGRYTINGTDVYEKRNGVVTKVNK